MTRRICPYGVGKGLAFSCIISTPSVIPFAVGATRCLVKTLSVRALSINMTVFNQSGEILFSRHPRLVGLKTHKAFTALDLLWCCF